MSDRVPIILVHGAWHGPWCWERVTPLLAARGIETHTVDLTTCCPDVPNASLHDDAAVVRHAIDAVGRDVIVVGHSYGGGVITEGAAHPAVRRLVYLTAFMLDEEESPLSVMAQHPNPELSSSLVNRPDGRHGLPDAAIRDLFYNDCDDETVRWATSQMRTMSAGGIRDAPTAVAWRTIPSTYVVCTLDRAIPPELQRMFAARASEVVELESGHSPFASMPGRLADLLESLVDGGA
jgi:pimeloyl-ACP methyl ester carboxylesterase